MISLSQIICEIQNTEMEDVIDQGIQPNFRKANNMVNRNKQLFVFIINTPYKISKHFLFVSNKQ